MNKRVLTIVILVVIILSGVVAFALTRDTSAPANTNQNTGNSGDNSQTSPDDNSNSGPSSDSGGNEGNIQRMIVYRNDGFIKTLLEIPAGAIITVKNDSDTTLDFASDDHPTHAVQPALNVGNIAPGESKTFSIKTPGTWGYHNHLNSSHAGQLIVK